MKKQIMILILIISSITFAKELLRISYADFVRLNSFTKEIDVAGSKDNQFIDIVADYDMKALLNSSGIKYIVKKQEFIKAVYPTYMQVADSIDKLHALYPAITDIDTLGYTAVNNFPIKILKINGVNPVTYNKQKSFLLMANHHAREWQTVTTSLFFVDSILRAYSTDANIKKLIDSVFIVVVPSVNPDGYNYSRTSDEWWRKNRTFRSGLYGVDLNRNYGGACNSNLRGDWGVLYNSSTSHYPNTEIYCGPYPNSEREVRFMQNLIKDYDFNISISLHSYSELVLWPYGYGTSIDTVLDNTLLSSLGAKIAAKLLKQNGTGTYTAQKADALYPVTGDSDNWIYGYTKYIKGKTTLSYTFEIDTGFSPPEANLDKLHRRVYLGLLYAAFNCCSLDGKIKEIPTKPISAITDNQMNWSEKNSSTASDYKIIQYDGESKKTDIASDTTLYSEYKFFIATTKAYSAPSSFRTINQNFSSSALEGRYSVIPSANDSFKCQVWYAFEDSYDMGLVEISEDGYEYKALDTLNSIFNESSGGWRQIKYPLSMFAGKEAYLRFRTMYDDATLDTGLYVDDIYPTTDFTSVAVYNPSIADTFINLNQADSNKLFAILPNHSAVGYTILSNRLKYLYITLLENDIPNFKDERELNSLYLPSTIIENSILKFYLSEKPDKPIEGKIYNMNGSVVKNFEIKDSGFTSFKLLNMSKGKYFVFINGKNARKFEIIIIK